MSVIERMKRSYNCLMEFRCSSSEEHKRLIDIFLPMICQDNKQYLKISVGKNVAESKFDSVLSMVTNHFGIGISCYMDEPQLIFNNNADGCHCAITSINLTRIKNIHIKEEKDGSVNFYRYLINFNYNDKIDYQIHIAIKDN